jgi:hypothetical protein
MNISRHAKTINAASLLQILIKHNLFNGLLLMSSSVPPIILIILIAIVKPQSSQVKIRKIKNAP